MKNASKKTRQQSSIIKTVPYPLILLTLLNLVQILFTSCSSQEERLWEKARKTDTVGAYEAFLKEFPSGGFSAQAQARLRKRREPGDWHKAESKDTIESYRTFLQQHPDGQKSSLAKLRMGKLARELERQMRLAQMRSTPTIDSLSAYLSDYPSSPEIGEIRVRLRPLLLAEALTGKTSDRCKAFLYYFPKDSAVQEVRSLLRPLLREKAHRERTAIAYDDFLSYFPEDHEAPDFRSRTEILSLASRDRWPASTGGSFRSLNSLSDELPLPFHLLGLFALSSDGFNSFEASLSQLEVMISKPKLISALNREGPISLEVCYFTKAHQLYLSEFVSALLSRALQRAHLEGWATALEERNEMPPDQVSERLLEIDRFNSFLDKFNSKEHEREAALRLFNEKLQIFSGLLPLQELSIYSSVDDKLKAAEVEPPGLAFPIFPLSEALELIRSGYVGEGFVLLDAIGKIKIAYLGILLAGDQDDHFRSEKIKVVETDLRHYYDFLVREVIPIAPSGSGDFPETLLAYAHVVQNLHSLDSFSEELQRAKSEGMARSYPWR